MVYAPLPSKRRSVSLKRLEPNLGPQTAMTNFEPAAFNLFETCVSRCWIGEFFTYPENKLLRPLLDYFEETRIADDRRRQGRRQTIFNVNFWNCYHACHEALRKTNNDVEGWHRRCSCLIYSYHPTIWKFIDSIRMDETQNRRKKNLRTNCWS